jgi:hypothetical protein
MYPESPLIVKAFLKDMHTEASANLAPPDQAFSQVLKRVLQVDQVPVTSGPIKGARGSCTYGYITASPEFKGTRIKLNQDVARGPRAQLVLAHEVGHYLLHYKTRRILTITSREAEIEAETFAGVLYSLYYGVIPKSARDYLVDWYGAENVTLTQQSDDMIMKHVDDLITRMYT